MQTHSISQVEITRRVDETLRQYLAACGLSGDLLAAVEYAVLGGGKRLRPILSWRCAEAVGGPGHASLPAGCAIELIHAFSLVHDDLPILDDDDVRRGRPTLHKHTNEPMALLAGDAMLTLAFDAVDQLCESESDALRLSLIRELNRGTNAMISGQVYDTLGGMPEGISEREKTELVHRNKTGALIRAACRMGAMLGIRSSSDDGRLAAITGFSERLGLIFQIVDDLLDVQGHADDVGKATGKDALLGKATYPGLLGVEGSRAEIDRLQEEAEQLLTPLGKAATPLLELSQRMSQRDR
ncbi:MAG: polyprenyl synthetase family protein [Phycisphaerales bacterium]